MMEMPPSQATSAKVALQTLRMWQQALASNHVSVSQGISRKTMPVGLVRRDIIAQQKLRKPNATVEQLHQKPVQMSTIVNACQGFMPIARETLAITLVCYAL